MLIVCVSKRPRRAPNYDDDDDNYDDKDDDDDDDNDDDDDDDDDDGDDDRITIIKFETTKTFTSDFVASVRMHLLIAYCALFGVCEKKQPC